MDYEIAKGVEEERVLRQPVVGTTPDADPEGALTGVQPGPDIARSYSVVPFTTLYLLFPDSYSSSTLS